MEVDIMDAMLDHTEQEINLSSYKWLNHIEKLVNGVSRDATIVSERLTIVKQQVVLVLPITT